ncbi:DUF721 domain-containing protein [Methylovirgula sp. 4M-Z18]|uniref:DUF721 domain-containing protein n=1 Tax=Methylovirgula sp. 4M-Z18 TaxID=2293567 RepID=UPI000E2E9A56|nr:DciA family protein [Methylovirgula sp. 4M-Z18]RFB80188.1 DUF721 domain-containing protein [Methylovirgula sp. 4M-Z18]
MFTPRKRSFTTPLADFVEPHLQGVFARKGFSETGLILSWPEIVGERFQDVCAPLAVQWPARPKTHTPDMPQPPATLVVQVEGAFAVELQHLAPLIVERANAYLGWRCIGRLALKQGPIVRHAKEKPPQAPVPPRALEQAGEATRGIEDEALRDALTRLGAHILARGKR